VRETLLNPRDGSILRLIPDGPFLMGSTEEQVATAAAADPEGGTFSLKHEQPQFLAELPDFYMSIHAVTNEQYARFLSETHPSQRDLALWKPWLGDIVPPSEGCGVYRVVSGREHHPADHVSWHGAEAYCRWAGMRLPTELEWEKGARGNDGRIYPWGNEWRPDHLRWHGHRSEAETTAPVDAFLEGSSPYGLLQMAGTVEEWCADYYHAGIYRQYATGNLSPPRSGCRRVIRGGNCMRRHPLEFRCAMRRGNDPALVNILYCGVRCALDSDPRIGSECGLARSPALGAR